MGNRTIRKEYEKTQTLFGIPDESGWAIPMPAINAGMTRDNVHAVFYTCQDAMAAEEEATPTPDVQFHMDDYSYTSLPDRTTTMLSEDGRGEGGFSDTVLRLGDLDAFFGGDDAIASNGSTLVGDTEYNETGETAPQLYDNRVYAILNRSLARTPSITSFQTSFGDSLATPTPRGDQPGIMTPTAFTAPPIPSASRGYAAAAVTGIPFNNGSRSVSSPQFNGNVGLKLSGDESLSLSDSDTDFTRDGQQYSDVDVAVPAPSNALMDARGSPDSAFLLDNLLDKLSDGKGKKRRVFRAGGGRNIHPNSLTRMRHLGGRS